MYCVIDIQTGVTVKMYNNARQARSYANRKDLEYGAVRYVVRYCE